VRAERLQSNRLDVEQWLAVGGNVGATPTGSIPGELMVSGVGSLVLFDDDEGARLWLTPNAINWDEVALQASMTALDVWGVDYGRGRFVALFNNKFAGGADTADGNSDEIWTSVDGRHWGQANVLGTDMRSPHSRLARPGFASSGATGRIVQSSGRRTTGPNGRPRPDVLTGDPDRRNWSRPSRLKARSREVRQGLGCSLSLPESF